MAKIKDYIQSKIESEKVRPLNAYLGLKVLAQTDADLILFVNEYSEWVLTSQAYELLCLNLSIEERKTTIAAPISARLAAQFYDTVYTVEDLLDGIPYLTGGFND